MTSHTPAPWTIEEYGDDDTPALVIHKDTETRVCFMATPGSHGDPAMIEADARLITAAPDLLAALKAIVHPDNEGIAYFVPSDAFATKLKDDARAAIAKAENSAAVASAKGDRAGDHG